ncbi:sugar phosphate isomerase/epimerase family protein [Subtercola boreus]|uniref:Sugar phosphate isomerase n=1 Tax=Subtercola boreus TaxID=120213 RepID=A0A3E0W6C7_9MICO|nr:TIM barrel protein [Subtercola boreus]RFA18031.1 sugar phosphate isomerase [Subtercola boreus]RFA18413.1 sugar phosphate isomerase [Subtercola boreus]RFA24942.1 sugar phosphate isomerase [Subtercola boreus]
MIGLSTFAYFWQLHASNPRRLDLAGVLADVSDRGVGLLQICDYAPLDELTPDALADVALRAGDLGVGIELGTKGVSPDHLLRYLELAKTFDATLVRSMVFSPGYRPTLAEAERDLNAVTRAYDDAGVTLALETYEQLPTNDLVSLIEAIGHPRVGICLDPANTVALLENPRDVIDRTAPFVANVHVKDFAFTRRGGWVGFTLEGAPLGTGLLDYEYLVETVRPNERGINQIIEHWLPLGASYEETVREENTWNTHTLNHLRSRTI